MKSPGTRRNPRAHWRGLQGRGLQGPRHVQQGHYHRQPAVTIEEGMNLGERKADNMTKTELIEEISSAVEMTRKDSEVIVEAIFNSVVRALRGGDRIEIRGFGSFRTRQRQPRVGRNPKTGARVEVPAKRIASFKPSKELKDLVNTDSTGRQSRESAHP
jgi:integration host factor subunit beta